MSTPWRAVAAALVLVAAAVRLAWLDADALWVDEIYSLEVARASLADVLWPGRLDFHPPAFYALLWSWRPLAGESAAALRLLPALIGLTGTLALARLAYRLGGGGAALLALALTATNRLHVTYSRELRGYALLFLGVALLLLAREAGSRWRIAARVLLAVTHFQGVLCVALEGLWDLARREHGPRALALEYGPAAVAALPWVVISLRYGAEHGRTGEPAGPLAAALGLLVLFASMTIGVGAPSTALAAASLHAAPFALGLVSRKDGSAGVPRGLLALLALGPFVVGALIPGSLRLSGMMAPLAPLLALSALGLAAAPPAVRWVLLGASLATSGVALTDLHRVPIHQEWREVAALVREHVAAGAVACGTGRDDALALRYHLGPDARVLSAEASPHFPALGAVPLLSGAPAKLVVVHSPLRWSWEQVRPPGYREVASRAFPRQFPLEVRLLERSAAPTPPPPAPR